MFAFLAFDGVLAVVRILVFLLYETVAVFTSNALDDDSFDCYGRTVVIATDNVMSTNIYQV